MNIDDVKKMISDYEVEVANDLEKTVEEVRKMRQVVNETISQRVTIIARKRRELAASDRIESLKLRHAREMIDLKKSIDEGLRAFDLNPEVSLHERIAERLGVDVFFAPGIMNGVKMMDEHEKGLWAAYRRPKWIRGDRD
jgi:hypothetical protein